MQCTCGTLVVHVACTCTCGVPVQQSILSCECNGYDIARRQARCGRSLATFLALQALICLVLYLRTAMLEALTVILP